MNIVFFRKILFYSCLCLMVIGCSEEEFSVKKGGKKMTELERRLTQQAREQFDYILNFSMGLEDKYAPRLDEMDEYYKIFDEKEFTKKWTFFPRFFTEKGIKFGESKEADWGFISMVTSNTSMVRLRSSAGTFESFSLSQNTCKIEDISYTVIDESEDLYDVTILFKHLPTGNVYGITNRSCWLRDRGCINYLSWKWEGKYNAATKGFYTPTLRYKDGYSAPEHTH